MDKHFRWLVLALCCAYLAVEARYVLGLPLVMDEFANAGHISRAMEGVPYRDYLPYKTVFGYYMLAPALVAFESSWTALMAAKLEIAVLTALALGAASLRLRRHFGAPAVLAGLLLLVTQSTFLERSAELRVDMLSALFGLGSLLAYLERRGWWAGGLAAVAVLMTQKGAYFVLAIGGAATCEVVRWRSRASMRELLQVSASVGAVMAGYIGLWCGIGGPAAVWRSMFLSPRRIAFEPLYSIRGFWLQTLERNPVFYGLGLVGLVLLAPRWRAREDTAGARLWSYGVVLTVGCLWHKQPWPYFFVLLIPTAWILAVATLERTLAHGRGWIVGIGVLVVLAAGASLARRLPAVLSRSSLGQRQVVEAGEAFLTPGDTYFAGLEMLWRHRHVEHVTWLDEPRMRDLRRRPDQALTEFRERPPRLLIDSYRLETLPSVVAEVLRHSHVAVGGNLHTYGPRLPQGAASTTWFALEGPYRVVGGAEAAVRLDGGAWLRPGDVTILGVGLHQTEAYGGARLASWSNAAAFVKETERPIRWLFQDVYTY